MTKQDKINEFHQLRADDNDVAEQYGKEEFDEWLADYDLMAKCILCDKNFTIGENGNELGFCIECQEKEQFPYDLDKYYKDYDNNKIGFKGFDTMSRGILEDYLK